MIRCTIDMLAPGDMDRPKTIGIIEIMNDGTGGKKLGNYIVILKRNPPWKGMLKKNLRNHKFSLDDCEWGNDVIEGKVEGFHMIKKGVYDLIYCALRSCIGHRNKERKVKDVIIKK